MKKIMLVTLMAMLLVVFVGCARRAREIISLELADWTVEKAYLKEEVITIGTVMLLVGYENPQFDEELLLNDPRISIRGDGYKEVEGSLRLNTDEVGDYQLRITFGGITLTFEYAVYHAIVDVDGVKYWDTGYIAEDTIQDAIDKSPANTEAEPQVWVFVMEGRYKLPRVPTDFTHNLKNGTGPFEDPDELSTLLFIKKGLVMRADNNVYIDVEPTPAYQESYPEHLTCVHFWVRNPGATIAESIVVIDGFIFESNWIDGVVIQQSAMNNTPIHFLNNTIFAPEEPNTSFGHGVQFSSPNSKAIGNTIYVPGKEETAEWGSSGVYLNHFTANTVVENNVFIMQIGPAFMNRGIVIHSSFNNHWPDTNMSNIRISNNTFIGGRSAIVAQKGTLSIDDLSVTDNIFIDNFQSIHLFYQYANNIPENNDNYGGFTNLDISNNEFINQHYLDGSYAIVLGPRDFKVGNFWRVGNLLSQVNLNQFIEENEFSELTPLIEELDNGYLEEPNSWHIVID